MGCGATIPIPINGATYSKREALSHISLTRKGTSQRSSLMHGMIKKGYAPASVRYLQLLMKKQERGELIINNEWSGVGRKRSFPDAAIEEYVRDMKSGEATGNTTVKTAMVKWQEQ